MPDIVCPLFDVPDSRPIIAKLAAEGIVIRHARVWEQTPVSAFITQHFSQGWADETLAGFSHQPVTVSIAIEKGTIIGFAAYDATARAYFGPTGVNEAYRGRGIGKALFYHAMEGLRELGYIYAFIGAPGPIEFYLKATPGLILPEAWTTVYSCQPGS